MQVALGVGWTSCLCRHLQARTSTGQRRCIVAKGTSLRLSLPTMRPNVATESVSRDLSAVADTQQRLSGSSATLRVLHDGAICGEVQRIRLEQRAAWLTLGRLLGRWADLNGFFYAVEEGCTARTGTQGRRHVSQPDKTCKTAATRLMADQAYMFRATLRKLCVFFQVYCRGGTMQQRSTSCTQSPCPFF